MNDCAQLYKDVNSDATPHAPVATPVHPESADCRSGGSNPSPSATNKIKVSINHCALNVLKRARILPVLVESKSNKKKYPLTVTVGAVRVRVYREPDGFCIGYYSGGKRTATRRKHEADAIAAAKRLALFLNHCPGKTASEVPWGAPEINDTTFDPVPARLLAVVPTATAVLIPRGTVVYFLTLRGNVVYVGQSRKLVFRLTHHIRLGREFDAVCYVPVPERELDHEEQRFIRIFQPVYNKVFVDKDGTRQVLPHVIEEYAAKRQLAKQLHRETL